MDRPMYVGLEENPKSQYVRDHPVELLGLIPDGKIRLSEGEAILLAKNLLTVVSQMMREQERRAAMMKAEERSANGPG